MKSSMPGLALLLPLAFVSCQQNSKPVATEKNVERKVDRTVERPVVVDKTADNKSAEKAAETKREIAEKKTETRNEADKKIGELKREEFAADANRELDRIDQNLKNLKAKASRMSGANKDSIEREIDVIQKRYDTLRDDVKDIKSKAELDLENAKARFHTSLRELERSYNDLAQRVG